MTISFDTELIAAAKNGLTAQLIDLLALRVESGLINPAALVVAAGGGYARCVDLLLPFCDPKFEDSLALRYAASNGHEECVKLLAPLSDPQALSCAALRLSAARGNVECVKFLLPLSCSDFALSDALNSSLLLGSTRLLAALLAHDPNLLERDKLDLPALFSQSLAARHGEMALFFGSIIDQQAIGDCLPPAPSSKPPTSLRI